MNSAAKRRLFQLIKTIHLRYFHSRITDSVLKIRKYPDFMVKQRGNSTSHNLMRDRKDYRARSKKDDTGIFGYFLLGMPVTAFILGTWQIQRHRWKLALIDDLEKRSATTPVDLPLHLSELESMEYCPVKVRGRFLHDKEFTIGPKSLIVKGAGVSEGAGGVLTPGSSNAGYCIVTPFELEGRDLTILVNRGWVPLKYTKNRKQAQTQSDEVVDLIGVVRLNERRPTFTPKNAPEGRSWLYRDLNAMAAHSGASPVYIELIASETVQGGPIAGQTRINLRNEHLSYIFTWYSLAIITGFMWHRIFIRKLPIM